MIPAFRSLDRDTRAGTPLPAVWKTLEAKDFRFYPGELTLLVGPPGGGKSALALAYAVHSGVTCLYVSLDMTQEMVAAKMGSILSGRPTKHIEAEMKSPAGREALREGIASRAGHVFLEARSRPTPEAIVSAELALEEVLGEPPQLLILDNAMNVAMSGDGEGPGLRELSQVMHWLAGDRQMAVVMLHHINLADEFLTRPAPLSKVKFQITELPAAVGSVCALGGRGKLLFAGLKNRHGPADPTGRSYVELDFYGASGVIQDPAPKQIHGGFYSPPEEY